jgi:hypothetical protein
MRMRTAVVMAILMYGMPALACSARSWSPEDLVENTPVPSANGRYAAIVREHDVPDFASDLAANVMREDAPRPERTEIAVYELEGRRLLGVIALGDGDGREVLVSDSGTAVAVGRSPLCGGALRASDVLVSVYRTSGERAGVLRAASAFNEYDLAHLRGVDVGFELRHESDTREVVVVRAAGAERRVSLEDAAMLDPKTDILPRPRVFVTAAGGFERPFIGDACAGDAVQVDSEELLREARHAPPPEFPDVALKARLRGIVRVEVAVSASGEVTCVRTSEFPFGLAEAAASAIRQWTFARRADGKPFRGELLVHFEDVPPESLSLPHVGRREEERQ